MSMTDNRKQDSGAVPSGAAPERLLTPAEVAAWLGVSEAWVRRRANGKAAPVLPVVRVNRSVLRFRECDLNDWVRRMKITVE